MTVTLEREQGATPPPATEAETRTHTMFVNDHGRQHTVTWTPGEECEAEAAEVFADRRARGYLTFATLAPGEHVQLHEFDASAPVIVASRPIQGG